MEMTPYLTDPKMHIFSHLNISKIGLLLTVSYNHCQPGSSHDIVVTLGKKSTKYQHQCPLD